MNATTSTLADFSGIEARKGMAATSPVNFSLAVAVAVFSTYLFTTSRLDENLQAIAIALMLAAVVFADRLLRKPWVWLGVFVALAGGVFLRPLDVPNHHILLTYISLMFAICLSAPREQQFGLIQHNARWLIVALMGIATLQRLFQSTFMDGGYLGFEMATGGFANPILKQLPWINSVFVENRALVDSLRSAPPGALDSVTLSAPFPFFQFVVGSFVVTILAIEAWICFLMWKFPKHWLTHLSIMAFGVTLVVLRQELTFISVVCLLGLLTLDRDRHFLRKTYAVLAVLVAAAVLKTVNLPGPIQL